MMRTIVNTDIDSGENVTVYSTTVVCYKIIFTSAGKKPSVCYYSPIYTHNWFNTHL